MSASLAITVYFLDGRYHGAGMWPPEPARLFQAFVAGAARGESLPPPAKEALLWLEKQSAPVIAAPPARRAKAVKRWVPNNDVDAVLCRRADGYAESVALVRTAKEDRPWIFNPAEPLLYVWDTQSDPPESLFSVVEGLYRLGHGIDPAFASVECLQPEESISLLNAYPGVLYRPGPGLGSAVPSSGTLSSLEGRHKAFGSRFKSDKNALAFRQPPKPRVSSVSYNPAPRRLLYQIRSLDPNDNGGFRPIPLTRAAMLVDSLLQQTAGRLAQVLPEHQGPIEQLLLGKGRVRPKSHMRVRVIPLPSSGHPEVDPSIRRVLVDIPSVCPIAADDIDWAFARLRPQGPVTLGLLDWQLERFEGRDTVAEYLTGMSRIWRTLTPVVLPEHRRGRTGAERRSVIEAYAHQARQALRHAEVRQKPTEIRVQLEPFQRHASRADQFDVPVRNAGGPVSTKRLMHMEIRFCELVEGPLLIGDGRFRGLGLFEPVRDCPGTWLFFISGSASIAPEVLARAARRAVMSRVASEMHTKGRDGLPAFFTGHETDGSPSRRGKRVHIGFLVDPESRHLLIATPHALNHTKPTTEQTKYARILNRAVSKMEHVVAGRHGAFDLSRMPLDDSPLMRPSKIWESATDYRPNRYGKGDPIVWIPDDVCRACICQELPLPSDIDVLRIFEGPRGGISARLRLVFSRQLKGPLSLGRTAMCGGGTFRALS